MSWSRPFTALLAAGSLLLAGCTSLLGDFSYDPNANSGGSGGTGNDDQGDIEIEPRTGLVTTEQGAKATFTIKLKRPPTATVTIILASSNENEGTVSPTTVSFTAENHNAPQMVQVTGVDDAVEDKNQIYTIRTFPAASEDSTYNLLNAVDPEVLNVDDESAGFLVTPTSGLVTSESGAEAMFSIALTRAPTADVTIGLSTDKPTEGVVGVPSLVFTPLNWMAPQLVTVTGVNDDAADGAQPYLVVAAPAVSQDAAYDKLKPLDVAVINQDNDTAGVTLMPQVGLVTFESGAMTTFGIVLNAPPTQDVLIPLASTNEAEGTVTPKEVLFTPLNWMAPQVVTITGVDDKRVDGNQPYLIETDAAQSQDPGYAGLLVPDAEVINIDNDTPDLVVTPLLGLITHEDADGAAATFTVNLASKPNGTVDVDVTSLRPEEGVASPALLSFTSENWEAPQVVTVTGVDDEVADGMQTYTVRVKPNASSQDEAYVAVLEKDVALSNTDDDSAGITVTAEPNLVTTEGGGSATFTVRLNSKPTADVRIPLTSSDTSEGTVTPAQLVFTPDNYSAPQVVTIKGANDDVADGHQPYRIITEQTVTDDAGYAPLNAANVDVTNRDDDSPDIVVTPSGNLTTGENGQTASFTVVLTSEPTADVNIAVASSDTSEGTVSTANLRFTRTNWSAPQMVTVRGVNDDVQDGAQPYRIVLGAATSDDLSYKNRDPLDVTARNTDNDTAGISLRNTNGLMTREDGSTASFSIVLDSQPTANVTLTISSSRTSEGTVSPAMVTFTPNNWAAPQTITIKGVNDDVADGGQIFRIITGAASSPDGNYNLKDPPDPTVTNVDDDSPGVTVTPTSGLATSESGSTATFTIVLNSQPTADVVLPLRSGKPAEGTISPASVTFTPANWRAPRTITLTGVNDDVDDGAQPYTIFTDPAMSSDAKYNAWDPPDVLASNTDNDSAGITVSAITGNTKEDGTTASFTIVLNSEPTANVSIGLSSTDPGEGTVSPSSVLFTPQNWSAPQKVTVTGVNDRVADGSQPYTVLTAGATSTDAEYSGRDVADVDLVNVDDDSAGFTVTAANRNTKEDGTSATFTVALNSQPTADVTIPLSSSNTDEGTLNVSSLTFTELDYASPKTVTITGVDDDFADGNQPYSILLGAVTSTDDGYAGLNPDDVSLSNVDDDSAGISVTAGGETDEDGDTFLIRVKLDSKPTANVTIPVSSSDTGEGTVSPASLTFTTNNWNSEQTITVTGVDDDLDDGAQPYTVRLQAATSTDANYDDMDAGDVGMSNVDNDSASIEVSEAAGNTSESGINTTFTIVLKSQPTASVTIPLSTSAPTEGSLAVTSVTFTTANWSSVQTVTVRGEDDDVADGHKPYKIVTGAAVSDDADYSGMTSDDVDVLNIDNDIAGVTVSVANGPTGEDGDTATFTVRLNSQPTASVSIPLTSSNVNEGTLTVDSVDFTVDNWASPQTITVTGVDDDVADGDRDYEITLGAPDSADGAYAALDPDDVALLNIDDDSAGIEVSAALGNVSESGSSTTFAIVLSSQPQGNVVIPLAVSDATEASLMVTSVSFNASNWQFAKNITVTGVDDSVKDGPQQFKVLTGEIASADADYDGKNPADVTITNADNDSAGIVVEPPDMTETGEAASAPNVTFTVRLTSEPTAPVSIPLVSSAPGEGAIASPASGTLVFDDSNWTGVTVTISGVDDALADGNAMFGIDVGLSESADANYDGIDPEDVTGLLNIDDEPPEPMD